MPQAATRLQESPVVHWLATSPRHSMAQVFDFSSFHRSQHLSDVTLVLALTEDEAADQAQPPAAKRARPARGKAAAARTPETPAGGEELPGHGVVLAGCSSYFASELARWVDREGPSRPRITLRVSSQAELDALRELIQWVYKRSLPEDASQQLLLTMLQLADRFSVQACAVACGDALSSQQLKWQTLEQLLMLPPFYHDNELFSGLMEKGSDLLAARLGDLEAAWADKKLRRFILQLPLKGLEMLLLDGSTCVYYENTALVVASVWLHQHSDGVTLEDKMRLAKALSVPLFTPFFAASVAMQTPWLVEALGVATLAAGMAFGHATDGMYELNNDAAFSNCSLGFPTTWKEGPRPLSQRCELVLEWQLKLAQLERVWKQGVALDSHTESFGGMEYWLRIVREVYIPAVDEDEDDDESDEGESEEGESDDGEGELDSQEEDESEEGEEEEEEEGEDEESEGESDSEEQEEGEAGSGSDQEMERWVLSARVMARLPDGAQLPGGCRVLMALPNASLTCMHPRTQTGVFVSDSGHPPFDPAEGWRCEDCWVTGPLAEWKPQRYADFLQMVLKVTEVA